MLVTGANGHLGCRLVPALLERDRSVVAVVRSERAAAQVSAACTGLNGTQQARLDVEVLDYTDVESLRRVGEPCDAAVHLVGILKEAPNTDYRTAHQRTTQALIEALDERPRRIVYLSIVGSRPGHANPCLASKGAAEALLATSRHSACSLQVPMVLGEGDYAAAALNAQVRRGFNLVFARGARDQPIYAGDVVTAIINALALGSEPEDGPLVLAGPEALDKRALIERAAAVFGSTTRVIGLPGGLGLLIADLLERLLANPPVTRAMLEVLNHDDNYDTGPALAALSLELLPLDDMLRRVLEPETGSN